MENLTFNEEEKKDILTKLEILKKKKEENKIRQEKIKEENKNLKKGSNKQIELLNIRKKKKKKKKKKKIILFQKKKLIKPKILNSKKKIYPLFKPKNGPSQQHVTKCSLR